MGILKDLPELEEWLTSVSRSWQRLSELFRKHELLLMCDELEWTCLFSHETGPGGWCAEQF